MIQEDQLPYNHRLVCLGCCNPRQGTIAANIWIVFIAVVAIGFEFHEINQEKIEDFILIMFFLLAQVFIGGWAIYGALKYKILPVQVSRIYVLVEIFFGVLRVFISLDFLLFLYILIQFYFIYLPQHYFVELHKLSGSMEQQRQPHDDETVTSEADNNENVHEGQGQDQFEMAQRNRNLEVV